MFGMADAWTITRENPGALPPAPDPCPPGAAEYRSGDDLDCRVCGEPAVRSFVASTPVGKRWVDLCGLHAEPLMQGEWRRLD